MSGGTYVQSEWLFIAVFVVMGPVLPTVAIVANWALAPKRPNLIKQQTYECGIDTMGSSWIQFKVGYYLFAMLFLIFDVETIFIVPWAVVMKKVGIVAFVEILIFFLILGLGLLYAWKKKALQWE